ncbi:hypothetical protein VTK56DRAFT_6330 [Thermocarpiscus australiensis]
MSAIAKCTIQDSADSEAGQVRQEERQTRLSEEPGSPCEFGICDTGYNNFGEPLYCECKPRKVAPGWQRPSDVCPRTGFSAHDTCFEEHPAFVGWDATRHRCRYAISTRNPIHS